VIAFGELWDAPMCEDAPTAPIPVGEHCDWCDTTIQDGDQGVLIPCVMADGAKLLPWHRECLMRSTVGSPAHLRGHCATACSGDGSESADPITPEQRRAEALESWRIINSGRVWIR